jgi:hypothetical protein
VMRTWLIDPLWAACESECEINPESLPPSLFELRRTGRSSGLRLLCRRSRHERPRLLPRSGSAASCCRSGAGGYGPTAAVTGCMETEVLGGNLLRHRLLRYLEPNVPSIKFTATLGKTPDSAMRVMDVLCWTLPPSRYVDAYPDASVHLTNSA